MSKHIEHRIARLEEAQERSRALDEEIKKLLAEILADDPTFDPADVIAEIERERANEQQ